MLAPATAIPAATPAHDPEILMGLFARTFRAENTVLVPHADAWRNGDTTRIANEPVYLPASMECPHHRIVFAHGFFSSALHEVAHWCVAGKRRRELPDYGYWYQPDGRNAEQQAEFERVEARPQAIEMAFAFACKFPFRVSTDNLSGVTPDVPAFEMKVRVAFERFRQHGFPPRAQRFMDVLTQHYGGSLPR